MNPIEAVTHPDPYPFYASLPPLYRDEAIGMWVATSAAACTRVLTHPAARVRPPAEPVPPAIAGTPAGELFAGLVRMTDGAAHAPMKASVQQRIAALGPLPVPPSEVLRGTSEELRGTKDDVNELAFTYPVRVLATMLGVEHDVAPLVRAFVRCMAGHDVDDGIRAARTLIELFGDPNVIGLMTQAHDATAGLITTSLLTGMSCMDVLRFDPPVQNTRRFFAEDAEIEGARIRAGDAVLVVLAAANRDPRGHGQLFTFGLGPHACAGEQLAIALAEAAMRHVAHREFERVAFHPSVNARIPLLRRRTQ